MSTSPDLSDTERQFGEMTIGDGSKNKEKKSDPVEKENLEVISSPTKITVNNLEGINNFSEFTFDNVIGHLEDMLMDEDFLILQNTFLEKYWQEFEDTEENKHSYMIIFEEYTNKIEDFISNYLKERIKNFDMDQFALELEERRNNLEGEIFEVLLTISDFKAFKEIILSYKAMKEGKTLDLSEFVSITSIS